MALLPYLPSWKMGFLLQIVLLQNSLGSHANTKKKQLIKEVQMSHFITRGQDQVAKLCCFLLPGSAEHLICTGTYSKLIGYFKDAMVTDKNHTEINMTPCHGLKGQCHEDANRSNNDITVAMIMHFKKLMQKATPQATRLVELMGGVKVDRIP